VGLFSWKVPIFCIVPGHRAWERSIPRDSTVPIYGLGVFEGSWSLSLFVPAASVRSIHAGSGSVPQRRLSLKSLDSARTHTMAQDMSLQVFAFDDLLVLYWQREEKISREIDVLLDNVVLPKPRLGAEFVEGPSYVLAAYAKGIKRRKEITVRIVDKSSQVLAEAVCKKLQALPAKLVGSWSPATRVRVEKILLIRAAKEFPELGASTRAKIADALAESNVFVHQCPNGAFYVRIPWPASAEPFMLDVTLRRSAAPESDAAAQSVKALVEGGYLHCFSGFPADEWKKNEVWIVDAGEHRYAPIKIKKVEKLSEDRSIHQWIDDVVSAYQGDSNALKAFFLIQLAPQQPRGEPKAAVARRLQGQVEGIRAGKAVGWAWDSERVQSPVRLSVSVDGIPVEEIEANLPRQDLNAQRLANSGFVWQIDARWLDGEPHEIHFRCAETGAVLGGSPLRLGRGQYDGDFEIDQTGAIAGWVKERCTNGGPAKIFIVIDGEDFKDVYGTAEIEDRDGSVRLSFKEVLPETVFDTKEHRIVVDVLNPELGRRVRLSTGLGIKSTYHGHIDFISPERIAGWVFNRTAPSRPVSLDLKVNDVLSASGRANLPRADVAESPGRCGFEFSIPPLDWESGSLNIALHLAGTQIQILGPAIQYTPYDIAVRSLVTAAEALNFGSSEESLAGGLKFGEDVTLWARSQILGKVLAELRRAKTIPSQITLSLGSMIRLPDFHEAEPVVDVIVPVYGGADETLRCIASVLNASNRTPFELVVVNDGSLDAALGEELRRLAEVRKFTLLENKQNLGFVGSVNRGMQLNPGRDVVLLNSDTEVADGWLDRLNRAAYRAPNIGTATPLSNNATICSFPEFNRENTIPDGWSLAAMDSLFAEVNAGKIVDLPTAVGFCMYIKRRALDEVGYFDQGKWGKGYAEENDFCLKASSIGWRHVAACDVFVEHAGGVSFADTKDEQINRNLGKLNGIYPDYAATVQRFIVQDPLAEPRNRAIREILKRHASRYMLFVIHGLGGGTKIAADELANRLAQEGVAVLELMSLTPGKWKLACHGLPYAMYYRGLDNFDAVLEDLKELGVWHIHYHQTMHFPRRIWELPAELGVAYDVSLHDYLPLCPRINMIDESGYYCGDAQDSAETCMRCIKLNGFDVGAADLPMRKKFEEFGGQVTEWRAIYGDLLKRARTVFAPSQTAAQIFQRHWPLPNLVTQEHPEANREISPLALADTGYGIAVIGAIGAHKGYDILLRCIRSAEKEGLPLRFTVIGYTRDDDALAKYGNVTVTGEYKPENLPRLIETSGCRVALFLSPWPETYCFTLSEACDNGLYPVALDIGAIAERLRKANYGRLIPLNCEAKEIDRILVDIFQQRIPEPQRLRKDEGVSGVLADYYGLSVKESGMAEKAAKKVRPILKSAN
jgi:GT2 family glycosyltransferase